jgi:uncharacterized protein (DUF983 family)
MWLSADGSHVTVISEAGAKLGARFAYWNNIMKQAWWHTALTGRCPECGQGSLFAGLLDFNKACPECGEAFGDEDAGDGPAVFVILAAGVLLVPVTLILLMAMKLAPWLVMMLMLPIGAGVIIGLLRVFKGGLYALQRLHNAGEGRISK